MIQIEQTELANYDANPPSHGNCLAACVASIFEIGHGLSEGRFKGVYDSQALWEWLAIHFPAVGMISRIYGKAVPLGSRVPEGFTGLQGVTPWVAVVRSPRTPHMHCVVMVADRLVWDPHPLREMGVGKQTGDYVFTLNHPEKLFSSGTVR